MRRERRIRAYGIRYITIGTGGDSHQGFGTPIAGSEVRDGNTYGILKLTLHATSYDWKFMPVAGSTFTDSGTQAVHDAPPSSNTAPVAVADSYQRRRGRRRLLLRRACSGTIRTRTVIPSRP